LNIKMGFDGHRTLESARHNDLVVLTVLIVDVAGVLNTAAYPRT